MILRHMTHGFSEGLWGRQARVCSWNLPMRCLTRCRFLPSPGLCSVCSSLCFLGSPPRQSACTQVLVVLGATFGGTQGGCFCCSNCGDMHEQMHDRISEVPDFSRPTRKCSVFPRFFHEVNVPGGDAAAVGNEAGGSYTYVETQKGIN